MLNWIKYTAFLIVVVNCTTTSQEQSWAPPKTSLLSQAQDNRIDRVSLENYFRNYLLTHTESRDQWWAKYQIAVLISKEKPLEACSLYTELSNDTRFPLNQVAFVRSYEVCKVTNLVQLHNTYDRYPWLGELISEIGVEKAKELNSNKDLAQFLYLKSIFLPIQSQKIKALKEGLELVKNTPEESELTMLIEGRLFKIAPRLAPKSKTLDPFKLAYDYRRARNFLKALRTYRSISKNPKASANEVYRALSGIRTVKKLMRDKEGVIQAARALEIQTRKWMMNVKTKKWKNASYYSNFYHKAALSLARTLWTEDRLSEALVTLNRAIQMLKGYKGLENIYWIQARIKEEKGDFAGAVSYAKKAIEGLKPERDIWAALKWQIAWNLRKIKKHKESSDHLEEFIHHVESPFDKSKGRYWLARNLKDSGDNIRSFVEYKNLIETDPLGYYGLLAYRELGEPIPSINGGRGPASFKETSKRSRSSQIDENLVEWLVTLNENELAKRYLLHSKAVLKEEKNEEKMISYFALAGDYNRVFSFLAKADPKLRNKMVLKSPKLLFPLPHYDIVSEASNRYGVRPELIYSIIRQESAFNRYARSPADAFGLMQLLPRVAKKTAHKLGLKYETAEDLYSPTLNVPLGTYHLKSLFEKFHDQFIISVASYNASERAVLGWVKTRYSGDPTEFIEDIPYRETKGYVKLVMRNLIFYQRLLADQPIPFPEWCLKGLQPFKS